MMHADSALESAIVGIALVLLALAALRAAAAAARFVYVYFLRPGKDLRAYGAWAVVTGATDGIGKAYAAELARRGLNLVLVSRTQSRLDDCAAELRARHGVEVATVAADLCRPDEATLERLGAALAGLDVGLLVNNAGASYEHPRFLEEVDAATEVDLLAINTLAPTLLAKLVLPGMKARRRGVIVNISSGNGLLPSVPLLASYAGTKAYVNQFTRSLDAEVRAHGLRVQDQPPLFVATKMAKLRPRLDVPSPEVWARAAARQVGYETSMTPYWVHGVMMAAIAAAPAWYVDRSVLEMHLGFRARALRRKAREAAEPKKDL